MCRARVAATTTATASTPARAPGPNAHDAAHTVAAASPPTAAPATGNAVNAPRPIATELRTGTTVPNAKAPASERITG